MARTRKEPTEVSETLAPEAEEAFAVEVEDETPEDDSDELVDESDDDSDSDSDEDGDELASFKDAANEAVENADETTATIPEQFLAKVTEEYRKLDGTKLKNQAKAVAEEGMRESLDNGSLSGAQAWVKIRDACVGGSAPAAPKAPVDPTEAFVQRGATLELAMELLGEDVPDGVQADWQTRVSEQVADNLDAAKAYFKWANDESDDKGDEPKVENVVKLATKVAQGKAAGRVTSSTGKVARTYTGARRDVAKHITEAFADKESGTYMKIAEIKAFASSEYAAGEVSAGAITARLWPRDGGPSNVAGIRQGVDPSDGKTKGGIKE